MVTVHIKENSIDGEELLKTGKLNLVSIIDLTVVCISASFAVINDHNVYCILNDICQLK